VGVMQCIQSLVVSKLASIYFPKLAVGTWQLAVQLAAGIDIVARQSHSFGCGAGNVNSGSFSGRCGVTLLSISYAFELPTRTDRAWLVLSAPLG
jgi:hypothetical protein